MRGRNKRHTASIALMCLALGLAAAPARAGTVSLWSQPSLFDTPAGLKQGVRDAGINLDVWLMNFGQGIISGDGESDNLKDGLAERGSGLEDAFIGLLRTTIKF